MKVLNENIVLELKPEDIKLIGEACGYASSYWNKIAKEDEEKGDTSVESSRKIARGYAVMQKKFREIYSGNIDKEEE